ncbi:hypothetical protein UlMin_023104 [Ulmus minor]
MNGAKEYHERNTMQVDRISELPEHIIHHTLSLLPTIEVVRMCLVSKHWKRLCYKLTALQFSEFSMGQNLTQRNFPTFLRFFYLLMTRDEEPLVSKLKLELCSFTRRSISLRSWFNFVLTNRSDVLANLKELDLCVETSDCVENHLLPETVFRLRSLTLLRLCGVMLKGLEFVNLPYLKSLSLENVQLDNQVLHNLLTSCSSLENLLLKKIVDVWHLNVSSSSLTSLKIDTGGSFTSKVNVEAKNLQSFVFIGSFSYPSLKFLSPCETIRDLSLCRAYFLNDKGLQSLLLKLPFLESLALDKCFFPGVVTICSPHLRHFAFRGEIISKGLETTIDTPNLVSFSFEGYVEPKLSLIASNPLKASIKLYRREFECRDVYDTHWYSDLLNFLANFDCFRNVNLQVISEKALVFPSQCRRLSRPPLPTLKHLKVKVMSPLSKNHDLRDALFWASPSLETLLIE